MANSFKTPHSRGPNMVDGKMEERIQSKDGTRWAYSRYFKKSVADRRWEAVKAWVLKMRDADGKAVTYFSGTDEKTARQWVSDKKGKV